MEVDGVFLGSALAANVRVLPCLESESRTETLETQLGSPCRLKLKVVPLLFLRCKIWSAEIFGRIAEVPFASPLKHVESEVAAQVQERDPAEQ